MDHLYGVDRAFIMLLIPEEDETPYAAPLAA